MWVCRANGAVVNSNPDKKGKAFSPVFPSARERSESDGVGVMVKG